MTISDESELGVFERMDLCWHWRIPHQGYSSAIEDIALGQLVHVVHMDKNTTVLKVLVAVLSGRNG